jgi:hypothetical protein
MYKPNFCAECGERIARLRWRVWTSRRFCAGCDRRFRRGRVVWPLAACAALVGAGFVGGRAMRPATPPLVIERSALKSPPPPAQTPATGNKESAATSKSNAPAYGADGTATERPTEADEVVSMCGARTKKGTPCSRRVRGTGRCWQHRGKSAMLSAAKLLVQD